MRIQNGVRLGGLAVILALEFPHAPLQADAINLQPGAVVDRPTARRRPASQ